MTRIRLQDGLPYVTMVLVYQDKQIELPSVLLDAGSAGTVFSADRVLSIGLHYEPEDTVQRIRGVGGTEFVFSKQVDRVLMGELQAADFQLEIGAMNYGFDLDGIVGMDFLAQVGAITDLAQLEVRLALR